jgi:uncharacterized protein (DUF169 family)
MINELKKRFGPKCLGLKVNYTKKFENSPLKQIRFCEAVNDAFKTPLLFNPQNLSCYGAKRSMGILKHDEELVQHIAQESRIASQIIRMAVNDIPHFESPIHNILMGIDEEMEKEVTPDMFILFISPKDVMELMKEYALKLSQYPIIKPYTFMSVCGSVFANTYKHGVISVSFGCPESRKYGGVKDNLMVVGIPYSVCSQLFR